MTSLEAAAAVVQALEDLGVAYMVVGSLSSSFYGIPRSTQDADFVVQLGNTSIRALADRLGAAFRLDPQMSFETVTGTYRYLFHVVEVPYKVEVFLLGDDAHDQERFRRRRRVTTLQGEASLPTAEDVIVTKLRWSLLGKRNKDMEDVRSVISVQRDTIDWDYVYLWCDRHGTRHLLDDIRRSLPPV